MKKLISIVLIFCCATLHMVCAQQYNNVGVGNQSCGKWIVDRRDNSYAAAIDESWVNGFLSGIGFIGYQGADPFKDTDAYGVWAWIDNYCNANPLSEITSAAIAFYKYHPN